MSVEGVLVDVMSVGNAAVHGVRVYGLDIGVQGLGRGFTCRA